MTASENLRANATHELTAPDGPTSLAESPREPALAGAPSTAVPVADLPQTAAEPGATRNAGSRPGKRRSPSASSPVAASAQTPNYPATTAPVSVGVLRELRRKRAKKLLLRVLLLVVLPTAISSVYFLMYASSEYESVSVVTIERRQPLDLGINRLHEDLRAAVVSNDPPVADSKSKKATTAEVREDALLAKEYVLSRDLFAKLDSELKLREHFSSSHVDAFSRLSQGSGRESAYAYFLKRVSVNHDPSAGTLSIRTRAFDAPMANRMNQSILRAAEVMLNALSTRVQTDQLTLLELELGRAKAAAERLAQARAKPVATSRGPVQPEQVTRLPEASPTAAARVEAESAQLAARRVDLLTESVALQRDEIAHQRLYVVRVAGPSEPDGASYPRRGRAVLTTLLASIIAMGILSLVFSAVREHTNL